MTFYSAGFTGILYGKPKYGSRFTYSASDCINSLIPSDWVITGYGISDTERKLIDENIKADILKVCKEMDLLFKNGEYGLPNIFYTAERLNWFIKKYCLNPENILCLELSIPETEASDLINEFHNKNELGIINALKMKKVTHNYEIFGYDLIGLEEYGYFHSFHCHDLEQIFIDEYQIKINEYGLINKYEDCERVIKWMNSIESGCEPVPWYICRIGSAKIT